MLTDQGSSCLFLATILDFTADLNLKWLLISKLQNLFFCLDPRSKIQDQAAHLRLRPLYLIFRIRIKSKNLVLLFMFSVLAKIQIQIIWFLSEIQDLTDANAASHNFCVGSKSFFRVSKRSYLHPCSSRIFYFWAHSFFFFFFLKAI